MGTEDEHEIIEKAKAGDQHAIKVLVDKYAPVIFRFAYNVCRNQDKAENTTQETFLSLLKKLDQFDNRSKFSTWLYTIVSNHCLMAARSNKSDRYLSIDDDESSLPEAMIDDASPDPYEHTERLDTKRRLDEAIEKLAPDYRVVFILRDLDGLSTEEVAEVLNLSIAAVKSRLHRARAFLREQLTPLFT
jgi:RNA polymerase sigma-70 factor (ECF subfamily)